jgi:glycosyltransferase involved in cell wall biosynthesis|tara:strand:+ start:531 stop:1424 length:894 start_codon:yes stop_codon:yes gene_type:complete
MFSIIIPTFNNLPYLKVCISSIKNNSHFDNEIIPHINKGEDGTEKYLISQNIKYTITKYNAGICEGVNNAAKKATTNYILYAHDDFYFLPGWDEVLMKEVKKIPHNKFYLSGVMMNNGPLKFDCGNTLENFDESKLLNNYKNVNHYDFQGSTWAPHLIHKTLWDDVGGFSEEYFPGTGSDPDLNMKLWNKGVRIFKGINNFKVYHFGSIVTRKYKNHPTIITESGSRGAKIFLLKWGVTINFFKKYILKSDTKYESQLIKPKKSLKYLSKFILCRLNYFYIKFIYNINNRHNLIKIK